MKTMSCVAYAVLIIALLIFSFPDRTFAAESASIQMGSTRVDITPPIGTPLAGYGKRHGRPSKGILDPLYARVMSLTNGKMTVVFVSLDLVLIDEPLRRAITDKASRLTSIPPENIMIFATHTHSGSGALGKRFWEKFISGKFDGKLFDETTTKIADGIRGAVSNELPVQAESGDIDATDLVENRMDEKLRIDIPLRVIRFRKMGGKVAGQMIFFAAHSTMLPASNRHFSADFPGVLSKILEQEHPDSVALFANGAAGDLRPHAIDSDYREKKMHAYAQSLAEKVRSTQFKPLDLSGEWKEKLIDVKLPHVKVRAGPVTIPSIIGNRFFPRKAVFQAFRLSNVFIMALPGEAASEIGYEIENRILGAGFRPYVIGFANDYTTYVIPRRYYRDREQYESQASFYGEKFDFLFHETADKLINALRDSHDVKKGFIRRDAAVPILFLQGSSYEMGFEHGRLMAPEIHAAKDNVYRFLSHQFYVPIFSRLVAKWVLMRSWKKMEPFVNYDEWMEMKGLAEGSGLSFRDVKRLHAVPDLIESHCSNGVYFGSATKDGRLIHIRNLDWLRQMGVHHFAALQVHKPDDGIPYVNIGYYGFIGSLSGVNEYGISVGQVGADSIDETLRGTPMPFLLKRVLRRADSLDRAAQIITLAPRTSAFNYMFADAQERRALAIETTASHFQLFIDNDPKESSVPYSFPMRNVLLRADAAMDPAIRNLQICAKGNPKKAGLELPDGSGAYDTRYKKHSKLVQENFGRIDVDMAKEFARSIAPDSNIQSVVYEFPDFWVANATGELPAAKTEYRQFNYEELQAEFKTAT